MLLTKKKRRNCYVEYVHIETGEKRCENPDHNDNIDMKPQYSYTMNGYLGSTQKGGALKVSEAREPSRVFFFAEENSWSLRQTQYSYYSREISAPLSTKALDDTVLLISPTPRARDCFATYHGTSLRNMNHGFGNVVFVLVLAILTAIS